MDGASPILNYGNASLQASTPGEFTVDPLIYFNANLEGTHTFVIDNNNGESVLSIDYLEFINVVGGTP
jgi:hypothetical protein